MKGRDAILTATLSALALLAGLATPLGALAQTKL